MWMSLQDISRPTPMCAASLAVSAACAGQGVHAANALTDEEKYLANPADLSGLALPDGCSGAKNVFLVFHGAGGPDRDDEPVAAGFGLRMARGRRRSACFSHAPPPASPVRREADRH